MINLIRFMSQRGLVVTLITIFLVSVGAYAVFKINREAFPNVNLDKVQISVSHPGASPNDVERLIIIPIEQELKTLTGIDKMTSVAFPGSARIDLELDPYATNRELIVSEVQLAVDRARLPTDLPNDPIVTEIDARVFPVIQIAIAAPYDEVKLKEISDRIKDDLLRINGVGRVQVQGDRKAEIRVVVDPARLRQHRVSVGQLAELLSGWNINASGGSILTPEGQKTVRIIGEFRTAEDAANLVIRSNERGQGLLLKDVAEVRASLVRAETYQDVSGKPAIHMIVMKQSDADIIDTVDRIHRYLGGVPQRYGAELEVETFEDFSRFARIRLGVLTNNGIVGVILVLVTLILFLRPSVAISTTLGLPIVFLTGLFLLYISGVTLNLISMMGFIMVLGMLVDDAIILGENITYHMENGVPPGEAAVIGSRELIGPVTTTILTTVVAFLPLMFISGILGKFIVAIPIVVISLLLLSWLESFLILPNHVVHLTHPERHVRQRRWLLWLEEKYASLLAFTLRFHWLMVVLALLMLLGSLYIAKTMRFELFPSTGIEQFMVRVTAKPGISLEAMRDNMYRVDERIRAQLNSEYVEATLITTGQTARDGGDAMVQRGSRFGQIRVIYIPAVLRTEHSALEDMYALKPLLQGEFPDLEFAYEEIKPGPPTGRALQVELVGSSYAVSETAARSLMTYLQGVNGVTTVESDVLPGDDELRVDFDRAMAAYAGVDLDTAAAHIRAAVDGLRVSTTRWTTEEVDITVRFPEMHPDNQLAQLRNLQITNSRGQLVTLDKIASFTEQPGLTTIRHKNGQRVINVLATVDPRVLTSSGINRLVKDNEATWLPAGLNSELEINYGGENEKNEESVRDLLFSFAFAMLAIFFLLAIQFNNLGYPIAVMLAIPFGIIGVVISFYVHDKLWTPMPLSFMSVLGTVALTGVVVNSSLVLLVFIKRSIEEGMPKVEAIITACRRRLRPVLLTAMTTIVGLLPTAYGWGGLDVFVSSMALALSWGLIFATLITLVIIPALFSAGLDITRMMRTLRRRKTL